MNLSDVLKDSGKREESWKVPKNKANVHAWKYYLENTEKKDVVQCTVCKGVLKSGNSTTNLMNHLKNHAKEYQEVVELCKETPKATQPSMTSFLKPSEAPLSQDSPIFQRITTLVAYMIGKDLQPFSMVEDVGFVTLLQYLAPRYKIPDRKYFRNTAFVKLYEDAVARVKQELSTIESYALTTDLWSSITGDGFITITAHWLDQDFEMKKKTLATRGVEVKHTAVNLREILEGSIVEWGLEAKPVFFVTDNGANIRKAVTDMAEKMALPCFAHTLQLCLDPAMTSIADLREKCRNLATYIRRNKNPRKKLRKYQKKHNIPVHTLTQEVDTRWNATYDMIERVLEQKEAIQYVVAGSGKLHLALTDEEWKSLEVALSFWHFFLSYFLH